MYSEAPRRRRKSSFAALYKTIIIDTETSQTDRINSSFMNPSTREEIINNQISLWDTEIEDWKKKAQEMKFKHCSKMKQINPVLTWKDCKDCLTADDVEIMKGKSSCEKLAKKVMQVDESRKIVSCLLDKNDVKVKLYMKKNCSSVFKMKKDICNYLLHCEESNDSLEFENDVST